MRKSTIFWVVVAIWMTFFIMMALAGCGDNNPVDRTTQSTPVILNCQDTISVSWHQDGTSVSEVVVSNNQQIQGGFLHIYKENLLYLQIDVDSIINYNNGQ